MDQDIILVTVDCWSPDALQHMPSISNAGGLSWETVPVTGNATKWSFPGILKGRFYSEVYKKSTDSATAGSHIASVLSEEGYSTGAFVASNPNVNDYLDPFDTAVNGDYYPDVTETEITKWLSRLRRFATLTKDVPADRLLNNAQEWYQSQSSPRFLWVHLMEPHEPYFAGFRRGRSIGILSIWRASINQFQSEGDLDEQTLSTLQEMHRQTLRYVDSVLEEHLCWLTDSVFVITGDHGERFGNGKAGHFGYTRNVMTTPFGTNQVNDISKVQDSRYLPKFLCECVDINPPPALQPSLVAESDTTPVIGGSVTKQMEGSITAGIYTEEGSKTVEIPKGQQAQDIDIPEDENLTKVINSVRDNGLTEAGNDLGNVPEGRLRELGYID